MKQLKNWFVQQLMTNFFIIYFTDGCPREEDKGSVKLVQEATVVDFISKNVPRVL